MATLGCVPASDRYFVFGLKSQKVVIGTYNIKSILELINFYENNIEQLDSVPQKFIVADMLYPQMKILDMGFWQIGIDSYLDANLIIIGGGNTEKYIATYVNQEFKNYIDHMLNKGAKVMGFSAGALLLGEKVYVSPNDNSDHQIKIKNGLGLFSQFLISVHYDSWNDKANKDRAEELVDVPIIPLNDHSCLVLDKLGNIIEKID
ncbi:(alpha)-aspartyl dipeptidase [Streptococcus parasanguinis]|uniref:(Alpha)-aspartyl dipeptidase n=1 Tax=Streptococcus parasanguinis TaxID=1318 RepID=A0A6N3CGX1_STRPA